MSMYMQYDVRVLINCMSDDQVSRRKRKTSSEKTPPSPIEAASAFESFDFTSSFCSSATEETPPAKKHRYELRNRSRADATVTPTTTVESSSAAATSATTITTLTSLV